MSFDPQFARDTVLSVVQAAYQVFHNPDVDPTLPAGYQKTGLLEADPTLLDLITELSDSARSFVQTVAGVTPVFGLVGKNTATKTAFVAIRGTQTPTEWLQNLDFDTTGYRPVPDFGDVHMGWMGLYETMRANLAANLPAATCASHAGTESSRCRPNMRLCWPSTPRRCILRQRSTCCPLTAMRDVVADAFRTGQGVPQEEYPPELFGAMEQMSATWLDGMLVEQWLPALDGMLQRLTRGAKVVDVGSGGGKALIAMAKRFPASQFTGYDLYGPNVVRSTAAAEAAGVADRVQFRHGDAVTELAGPLDLVTMFDVLHDAPDPEALLAASHKALGPGSGVLLVLESRSTDEPEDNAGPQSTVLYATSTLYCVPTALADGGPALGTLGLPPAALTALARRAGFKAIEEVPIQSPMNSLYKLVP